MNDLDQADRQPARDVNWTAIFASYCSGASLEDICTIHGPTMMQLKQKAARENWKALRLSLPLVTNVELPLSITDERGRNALDALPAEAKMQALQVTENRKRNFEAAQKLFDDVLKMATLLQKNELKIKKPFKVKTVNADKSQHEEVILVDCDLTIQDRAALATYAKTVAEMSYRALGDTASSDKPNDNGSGSHVPAITFILPGAIAVPRNERELPSANSHPVIDVTPGTTETDAARRG